MKHHSLTCLLIDDQVATFPSVIRDDALLAQKPPTFVLRFDDKRSTANALIRLPSAQNIKLIQIDTAVFSYEPILTALQEKQVLLRRKYYSSRKAWVSVAPFITHRRSLGLYSNGPTEYYQGVCGMPSPLPHC